jgi:Uma2 family endonuclease
MASTKPRHLLSLEYDRYAREYLHRLPPEHFMEAFGQSTQRKITVESLDLVQARRPEVQAFSELLVQYPHGREPRPHQVVPDNMVVIHDAPLKVEGSFDVPTQPARPFWVLEYVSKNSKRKDYDDSFYKYEQELKVPYYLLFHPEEQELTLSRHNKRKYVSVKPNEHGRLALPKLELEIGLREEWCRFWYRGELLPLPADLLRELEDSRRQTEEEKQRADRAEQIAEQERQARLALEQELARLKSQLKRFQAKRDEK